jgi:hypothetical protein
MNETQTMKGAVVKTLAIVGFMVTIGFLVYFAIAGVKHAPEGLASLATIAEKVNLYQPDAPELTVATEKIVVNSEESFQVSWTDMRDDGEYQFTYDCVPGVRLTVRSTDGVFVPMGCSETLTLPADVHGLFLTAISDDMRFTDIPLTVAFSKKDGSDAISNTTKLTVINATIPVQVATSEDGSPDESKEVPVVSVIETPVVPESEPKETTPVIETTPKAPETSLPVTPEVKTYSDLSITPVASGVLKNGVFSSAVIFDRDLNNAVQFKVQNIGTKTSGTWSFTTVLPSGEVYTSPMQTPLAPQAYVVFTLGFYLDASAPSTVGFTHTLSTSGADASTKNNIASQSVRVTQ